MYENTQFKKKIIDLLDDGHFRKCMYPPLYIDYS